MLRHGVDTTREIEACSRSKGMLRFVDHIGVTEHIRSDKGTLDVEPL